MLRQMHDSAIFIRLRFTSSEWLLLVVAAGLVCASIVQLVVAPIGSAAMVLAAVAIVALVHERANTRQMVRLLGERLGEAPTLADKLEVAGVSDFAMLDHALNRMIQRSREQAQAAERLRATETAASLAVGEPRMAAVLAVGVRRGTSESFSEQHLETLLQVAELAQPEDKGHALQLQSDGLLLIACGVQEQQPVAVSIRQALALVQTLSRNPELRFGLSCGPVRLCSGGNTAPSLVGAPFEDSARLFRMAAAWHEYQLLAAEPVALLARPFHSQRTSLTLSHAVAPALPVYSIELEAAAVAMSA